MKVSILSYGAGNLHSLAKAIGFTGAETRIVTELGDALDSNALVLPGVGAFQTAAESFASMRSTLKSALENGFPCLGICLGMQLLFDESEEGPGRGVGLIPGAVRRLRSERVPQIGWNNVDPVEEARDLFTGFETGYYANSYVCAPEDAGCITAVTSYDQQTFPAAVRRARTIGVQFHPEKSSRAGVDLLGRMLDEVTR